MFALCKILGSLHRGFRILLGIRFGWCLWECNTTAKASVCSPKFRSRRYFTPSSLLTLYKAQILPCLEYGSHLWRGASKHSLATLDAIQKRAIKLIGDPTLTNSLDSLPHRRTISALSLYYRYYHGVCSAELKSKILPKAASTRNTRFSNAQHCFAVKFDKNRTSAFANSFIPLTPRDWNSFPATVFPATYNFQLFKTHIHRYLQLLPSP